MQIKTTVIYPYIFIRITKVKKTDNPAVLLLHIPLTVLKFQIKIIIKSYIYLTYN